jgi:hypothetical protein
MVYLELVDYEPIAAPLSSRARRVEEPAEATAGA